MRSIIDFLLRNTLHAGGFVDGDPGNEGDGVNINGTVYDAVLKASDIGAGTNNPLMQLHRHSTINGPLLLGTRSNSNTAAHSIVLTGQTLLGMYAAGWDGANYALGGSINWIVDGTPGVDDMPTAIVFSTTPDGFQVPVDHLLIRASGDVEVQAGELKVITAGKGLSVAEGANARMGTGTLNGAAEVTINTTAVTANSRIFLSIQAPGGTPSGQIYVSSRIAGTSFGVKSVALDTSTFAWLIVEPA